jgi:hypothetical protein
MFNKSILLALTILALFTLACGLTFNLPITDIKTGATVTEDIHIPLSDTTDEVAEITMNFGAGELKLAPGAEDALLSGTATYNIQDFKPEITTDGNQVTIQTGDLEIKGIPNFGEDYRNTWDFELDDTPIELRINSGAYQGRFELGDLALKSLRVADGAADVRLSFSEPNKTQMETLRYDTGASSVKLSGLANANFERLSFKGGVGEYILDFSGELQRDAMVTVDAGLSSVTIIVPKGVPARVFVDGGLANVDVGGDWVKMGSEYIQSGEGPRISVNVNIGAGNVEIRN